MANRTTRYIISALLAGIASGLAIHHFVDPSNAAKLMDLLALMSEFFLKLIKMIIAPLVLATLVSGIGHMGDTSALGRMGARTIGWFLLAGFTSTALGLLAVDLTRPGVGVALSISGTGSSAMISPSHFDLRTFVLDLVPSSIVDAMGRNAILQTVVFACFAGGAAASLGHRAKPIVEAADSLGHIMLRITEYAMRLAPLAVFASVAGTVAKEGAGILGTFGYFIGSFYLAALLLCCLFFGAAALSVGTIRATALFKAIREPFMVAFSTASSEAAFPKTLEAVEQFGVPARIAGFVLPLGYSFNLAGSMMYCSFATMFVAQAYGIDISLSQQCSMLLLLMVTSKGIAGVPRASLLVVSSALATFKIPEGGVLLILAVDQFLDMGRAGTNVIGNAVASVLVAKGENVLSNELPSL